MHETGIAQNILDIAIDTAKQNDAKKINTVSVNIGKMNAIDEASLRFAFDALKAGTMAEDAELIYNEIALIGECQDCGYSSELEGYFVQCPNCQSGMVKIISGNELAVTHIEVD